MVKAVKILAFLVLCLFVSLGVVKDVWAVGGLSTSGQGERAISMGGAFVAVADDGSAVYYNPAGLTQIQGQSAEAGVLFLQTKIAHTNTSGTETSQHRGSVGPYLFLSMDKLRPFTFGLGVYAPFVRDSDFGSSSDPNFGDQSAFTMRKDYSPVIAYQINPKLSIGTGLIIGEGKVKQRFSTGAGSPVVICDEADGYGFGGTVGLLYKVKDNLKVGAVYRSRMDVKFKGQRETISGAVTQQDSKFNYHFPASAAIGIAYEPTDKLTLAFDVDWTDWSYLYEVVSKFESAEDSTTTLDSEDTVDYRLGAEFKINSTTSMRLGYSYMQAAFPSQWILPCKPDADNQAISLGLSKSLGNLKLGVMYEYLFTEDLDVDNNAYSFNGRYKVEQHTVGLKAAYAF